MQIFDVLLMKLSEELETLTMQVGPSLRALKSGTSLPFKISLSFSVSVLSRSVSLPPPSLFPQ